MKRVRSIGQVITLLLLSCLVPYQAYAGYLTLPINPVDDEGITSWFDHTNPDNSQDGEMIRYDGTIFTGDDASLSLCTNGVGCYDGHNGTDFAVASGTNVLAAADGQVNDLYWNDSGGWTMRVWHSAAGLSTLYAHIATTSYATTTDLVTRGETIATSNSTGVGETGPHLHFGVAVGNSSSASISHRIDPFGWTGTSTDPWSYDQGYLWTTNPPSLDASSTPSDWYSSSWGYRVKITIDHTKVAADLTDYPVYVNLADLPSGFFTHARSDGGDIRVTESDGLTEVPREVTAYNTTTSTGELYFKASSLSHTTDTDFYIYYGDSGAADYSTSATYGRNNVWDDYIRVYHGSNVDSSGNSNGTFDGSVTATTSYAKLGDGAIGFPANSVYDDFNTGNVTGRTIQGWARNADTDSYAGYFVDARLSLGNGWSYFENTTQTLNHGADFTSYLNGSATGGSGIASTSFNVWNMVALRTSSQWTDSPLYFGNRYGGRVPNDGFVGQMDELRITKTADLSSNWIATDYNNENSPTTFYGVGAQEVM